jgi:methylmalonyl-CoA mutase N-terminal domain/subunit
LIACIESGWARAEVAASAYDWRQQVEDGEKVIVGVNKFTGDEGDATPVFQPDPEVAGLALADLERHRAGRDEAGVQRSLETLRSAGEQVMSGREIGSVTAALVAAADADATLGDMQSVLFDVFGRNK